MPGNLQYESAERKFQSTLPVSRERCFLPVAVEPIHRSFNPRSPFPGSDAQPLKTSQRRTTVSIHAPRFQGAMQRMHRFNAMGRISFNPRSPFPGSDASRRPPVAGIHVCFNPRSPFPGSDAGASKGLSFAVDVSIHAPRFQGAMQQQADKSRRNREFQSTLPVSRERCPCRTAHALSASRFNPRSPFPGSDARRQRCFTP